ncbi:hypothetical protein BUALT_Bualt07G0048800 [Buddleja alternifolia]|uniref:NB-ARC domain-containing protein n=1 Tax=Buddleja alternifolia TaxID=168488 RepID=A0AAV6XIY5_9LAMI|nr:hypothetical protein BUALT_Bualt07G0048800 [Buddleja alternifolia]
MAVAAYAFVTSLLHVLDNIQHPIRRRRRLLPNAKQIETLQEKVHFLPEFLEDHSQGERDHINYLGRQIAEVDDEAEDIIDSHVEDQLRERNEEETDEHETDEDMGRLSLLFSQMNIGADHVAGHQLHGGYSESRIDIAISSSFCQDIDKVIEKIDSIKNRVDYYVMTVGEWGDFHVGLSNTDSRQRRRTDGKKKYSSANVVVGGVSNNLVPANDHLSGIHNIIINRSLVDKESPKDKQTYSVLEQNPTVSVQVGSSTLPSHGKITRVVGFDGHLVRIMELLTTDQPNLQIIPIVGMGGIGKTTLARIVFENKYIVEKFDKRVWFTISQKYSMRDILLGILRVIGVPRESETLAELGERLHKHLFGRRYLIVMDDLWSTKGWEDFKVYFPDSGNRNRVIVTTRLSDVAVSLGSHMPYLVDFLDEDKSWNLLCEKAFTQRSSSPELEEIGKRIAKSCKGLPLAIVVIGGLLAKSNMTREYWESVAKKVNLFVIFENEEDCFKILSLSYNHLPIHLKSCFLYMGFFPEDYEIRISKLIKSWVVGGFLKPRRGKSLEEVAIEYLKDLMERNLLLIRKRGLLGEIKRCGVHDLLRDLCWRESLKEHFLSVPKSQHVDLCFEENDEHRYSLICEGVKVHLPKVLVGSRSTSLISPLVGVSYPQPIRLSWLGVKHGRHSQELPQYTKLRCLSLNSFGSLDFLSPSTISQFWNLQALYFDGGILPNVVLPSEIWEMPQLRYVIIPEGFHLLIVTQIESLIILENLHMFDKILDFRCTEDVVKRIPNLKELRISYSNHGEVDWSYYCLHNIANLHKLESLELQYYTSSYENIAFPYSLKKLSNLYGDDWNSVEGGFRQLKVLKINGLCFKCWRAESTHFPKLEVLQFGDMEFLEEIPCGIGEIETLLDGSCQLFDELSERDVFSWTSLLSAYAESGNMCRAGRLFSEMTVRNDVSWAVMVSGFVSCGRYTEALRYFHEMFCYIKPNEVVLVCALSACAHLGLSIHGLGENAIRVVKQMLAENLNPNGIVVLGILNCCSHSGLVEKGSSIFYNMESL